MRRLIFVLLCPFALLQGQHFAPIANGYYAGIHAAKVNPAFTAFSNYNWHINLIGVWGNVNNNYLTLHLPYSAYRYINNSVPAQYKTDKGNPTWKDSWLIERLNGRPKHAAVGAMIYGPSFTIKLKNNWHVGLLTDATALARVSGLTESLAHALYKQLDTAKQAFSLFKSGNGAVNKIHKLTLSANAYASIGINVSKDIPLDWKNHLLLGGTLKRAFGFGGGYFKSGAMAVTNVNSDSVTLDRSNIQYASYSGVGHGTGLDLGVGWVYNKPEYRQPGGYQKKHTLYLFKFGFSLLDIGSIKYKNADVTTIINNRVTGWNINNEKQRFDGAQVGTQLFDTVLNAIPNMRHSTKDIRIGLPTRMVLSADYQVMPSIFINGQIVQSLRGRYSIHARQQSYVMVAPRWESDFFEVTLPVYLEYDYRAFRMGAAFRAGPLYIGSNSVMSLLYTRRVRDADFFIGIAFGDIPGSWKTRWLKKHGKKKPAENEKDCEKM